ncbi:cytochrome P450 [Bombardia bombarda]|uniref:Cytochrome P450 n=1 Tax=Bombardia bombarda TaxID=252184 RepID=A0AA39XI22_9PEZI|nr:cytochrome P450 [Bombardia bombarda]
MVALVLYRLTLHPLASYPGPLLGRITNWYSVIDSLGGDRHIHLLELHKKHGPFVRIGPNIISVNTAEGLRGIYGPGANVRKSNYYTMFKKVFEADSIFSTLDPGPHSRKKRVLANALSETSIRAMEELVLRNIDKFITILGGDNDVVDVQNLDRWSNPKNMHDWAGYMTLDVISDVCFTNSFEMLDKPDNRPLTKELALGVRGLYVAGWMPALYSLRIFFGPLLANLYATLDRFKGFAREQTQRRIALQAAPGYVQHTDIYSHLLAANVKGVEDQQRPLFTQAELVGETSVLISAGSDTLSASLSAEIRGGSDFISSPPRFNSLDEIRWTNPKLTECSYLRACIDEAMRMSPAIPSLLPRRVLRGGVDIANHYFPEGTDLSVSAYAIHHNEDYFENSFEYLPERWLSGGGDGSKQSAPTSAYTPFSIGPFGCPGRSLAIKELLVTIARIVFMYDIRLTPGKEDFGAGGPGKGPGREREGECQIQDDFVGAPDGPWVQFRTRQTETDE